MATFIVRYVVAGTVLMSSCTAGGSNYYYGSIVASFVSDTFRANQIVPDILDVPPTQIANVQFDGGKALLGNELMPSGLINQPVVSWPFDSRRNDQLYTVTLLDADAPSRSNASFRSVLHWLVYNIRGNDLSSGQPYTTYVGSTPGSGTGFHRYIILVLPQLQGRLTLPLISGAFAPERIGFDLRTFASRYGLGNPVAGNFYEAQADSYSISYWASQQRT